MLASIAMDSGVVIAGTVSPVVLGHTLISGHLTFYQNHEISINYSSVNIHNI